MKTLVTLIGAGLLSASTFASDKTEDLKTLSNVRTQNQTVNVYLKNGINEATIAILDKDESRIHLKKVKNVSENLMIPYNLEELPTGAYTVVISSEDSQIEFIVNNEQPAIPVANLPLRANAKLVDENTVALSVYGLVEAGVEVKIRKESNNEILHLESVDSPDSFTKNFSFEGLNSEDVYFQLTDALGRTKEIHL